MSKETKATWLVAIRLEETLKEIEKELNELIETKSIEQEVLNRIGRLKAYHFTISNLLEMEKQNEK